MFWLFKKCVVFLVLVLWGIIGLLYWLPLLISVVSWYALMLIASTFKQINMRPVDSRLMADMYFWLNGFRRIIQASKETDINQHYDPSIATLIEIIIDNWLQILGVILFWVFIYFWIRMGNIKLRIVSLIVFIILCSLPHLLRDPNIASGSIAEDSDANKLRQQAESLKNELEDMKKGEQNDRVD